MQLFGALLRACLSADKTAEIVFLLILQIVWEYNYTPS